MARIDYNSVGAVYDAARSLDLEGLEHWRRAIEPWLPPDARVLDVGAGTGQFAAAFPVWFTCRVAALEPAAAMRSVGVRKVSGLAVDYVAADACRIPFRDGSCDLAWLSTVIHHIPDLPGCARELRRVLRPRTPVLIRSAFPGRTGGITLFHYFPEAASVVESYPTIDQTVSTFERAGFAFRKLQSVPQVSTGSLEELRRRAAARADTTLKLISDEEFQRGLRRLDTAISAQDRPAAVVDHLDLLILR